MDGFDVLGFLMVTCLTSMSQWLRWAQSATPSGYTAQSWRLMPAGSPVMRPVALSTRTVW
jgi:hypothetical protein